MRTLTAGLVVGVVTALLSGLSAGPTQAARRPMPGNFTGFAFDTCDAPSQRQMDAWRTSSRYAGVGIYIAGRNRACKEQRHLTRDWVRTQTRKGWRILPLVVGRQAACSPRGRYGPLINDKPANSYAKARKQGQADASTGIQAARGLGISRRSTLWFDLEHFDTSRTHCRRSALAFVSGWTRRLHQAGFRSGFYSSASSGIAAVENARRLSPGSYQLPDHLWFAEWNGRPTLRSTHFSEDGWWPHRRVHQFRGGHHERHGGARLNVDSNFLSIGRGTIAGRVAPHCNVRISFSSYPRLSRGDRGAHVRAAQCLLRQQQRYDGRLHGHYNRATARSVRRFQDHRPGVASSGVVGAATWRSLLVAGPTPLLKYGSGGNAVRRLQRALNVAGGGPAKVDGTFAKREVKLVQRLQRHRGLPATGVVTSQVWRQLKRGNG